MKPRLLATLCATLALSACAPHSDIRPSGQLASAEQYGPLTDTAAGTWQLREDYWTAFGDAQLNALLADALSRSPSLEAADARIRRAEALTEAAGSALWPQLGLNGESTSQRFTEHGMVSPTYAGKTHTNNSLTLNAGIELDLWGKYRRALDGAKASREAAALEARAARVALAATLTRAYIEFDRLHRQHALLENLLALRSEAEKLQGVRVKAGLDAEIDRNLQQQSIAQLRTDLAQLDERLAVQADALTALAARGPGEAARLQAPTIRGDLDARLPSLLPSDLLANRPDLKAARLRVEAASAEVDYARDQFYPSVNLAGFLGFSSIGLDNLLDPGSRIRGIGPTLRLPIFEAGRLRSGLASKAAEQDAAVAQYNAALLDALREVADQARGLDGAARQSERIAEARQAAERGEKLVATRISQGLASRIQLLSARMQVLAQDRAALDVRAHRLDAAVGLARALGGGVPASQSPFVQQDAPKS